MAERLLDDDARVLRQPGFVEPLDDRPEEEGRDLEVEDRPLGPVDRLGDAFVRRRIREVARHVRKPVGKALEGLRIDSLARSLDRRSGALLQVLDRPIVDRNADDRAVEQPASLEAVERHERHHLRQVAGDSKGDEDVCGLTLLIRSRQRLRGSHRGRHLGLSSP